MRVPPQTLFLGAVFVLGATLANVVEDRLRSSDRGTPGASHASLEQADAAEFLDGALQYRVGADSMRFREDGSVRMDSISGEFPQDGGTVAFRASNGSVTPGEKTLSLSGAVEVVMPERHGGVVTAPSIDLLIGEGGLAGNEGVTIDIGSRAKIVARSIRWVPGSPMELEEVVMTTSP